MNFKDLPAFLEYLEKNNHLKRIKEVVSTQLEVTEISKRFLHNNGPALFFEKTLPVIVTSEREALITPS